MFTSLFVISATPPLKCHYCHDYEEECLKTNDVTSCPGSQYSCLLHYEETKILNEDGRYDFSRTVTQDCVVENRNYCENRMRSDPGILSCKVSNTKLFSDQWNKNCQMNFNSFTIFCSEGFVYLIISFAGIKISYDFPLGTIF